LNGHGSDHRNGYEQVSELFRHLSEF
jgi:hypothetical protein